MNDSAPIRVVVADDSAFMRRLIGDTLTKQNMDVVAVVSDGNAALEACERLQPDVLSLDLAMPHLDGIGVLRQLQRKSVTRVVVVSSFDQAAGMYAVDALAEGAFDLVPKVNGSGALSDFTDMLIEKITLAGISAPQRPTPRRRMRLGGRPRSSGDAESGAVVMIATSTGGPRALARVMPELPSELGAGTLIVQHMPTGFTNSLAARLDAASQLGVKEAETGDSLSPGRALLAPGGLHMDIRRGGVELSDDPPVGGLRPCADRTIISAVETYGSRMVLVVLTGMGRDGTEGARAVREAGGSVIVQDEESCTVYGMPRSIVENGLANAVVPLADIARSIDQSVRA